MQSIVPITDTFLDSHSLHIIVNDNTLHPFFEPYLF
jgi:hypothetical protein